MVSQRDTAVARIEVDEVATGDDRHIADHGTLSPADLNLVRKKRMDANRLTFGVLLLFFRQHGRFPRDMTEVDDGIISAVALQLGVQAPSHTPGLLSDRTAERHRAEIFPDQAMTLAAIDRLVHHATILEMNVESYRRREALDRKRGRGRPATLATPKTTEKAES